MNTWHAAPADLAAYRTGVDDPVLASSVEAHLLRCPSCRNALAMAGGPRAAEETERRWVQLAGVVDRSPRRSLLRIGVSTRPLRNAWIAAVLLVFVVPVLAAPFPGVGMPNLLLALAPLAPTVAVALAYRSVSDPAGEMSLATPMAGLQMISTRALLVGLTAAPLGILAAFVLELPLHLAVAWLLPGLALSALVLLAGTTRLDPQLVAGVLGAGWAIAVAAPTTSRRIPAEVVANQVAGADTQLVALTVAVLALALAVSRREQVAYRRSA